ncbi:MAG: crossover junction endodeoxyribonuclease RuvC [Gammaproteobacteria bacterium]|nr:crossover junction endodeoxyribonuclease RuvC [Gammaproteobacteria bacterium]MAY02135.1 crossover junction endodeoxyribonuclease RuvC [Gammaproteobacteria bacterium]|tara:strand:+ start:642 stop:1175 length:534 start_codon:yes stop_codon:yes gene_type:complete
MALILGIDPGSRVCGYGLINTAGKKLEYVASGCIRVAKLEFNERLKVIYDDLTAIIEKYQPDEVALEEIFVGRSPVSALKLGHARGVVIVACRNLELPVFEYPPNQIKKALVGKGRADKEQMQHMVMSILSLQAKPQEDAADALCVAVCHVHTQSSLIKISGVQGSRRRRLQEEIKR